MPHIEPQIKLQWFVDVNRPAVEWKGQLRSRGDWWQHTSRRLVSGERSTSPVEAWFRVAGVRDNCSTSSHRNVFERLWKSNPRLSRLPGAALRPPTTRPP